MNICIFTEEYIDLGPVHTYPDIFVSATFSFQIKKSPRVDVAYSNRIGHFRYIKILTWLRGLGE